MPSLSSFGEEGYPEEQALNRKKTRAGSTTYRITVGFGSTGGCCPEASNAAASLGGLGLCNGAPALPLANEVREVPATAVTR